ncbi:hypothetical protein SAMN05216482_1494 [Streptomyces sp. PAN_FS17]|nr:hypothetical protein SAMN05216482_1494 [Streptomyces sp. PAN_FS17]
MLPEPVPLSSLPPLFTPAQRHGQGRALRMHPGRFRVVTPGGGGGAGFDIPDTDAPAWRGPMLPWSRWTPARPGPQPAHAAEVMADAGLTTAAVGRCCPGHGGRRPGQSRSRPTRPGHGRRQPGHDRSRPRLGRTRAPPPGQAGPAPSTGPGRTRPLHRLRPDPPPPPAQAGPAPSTGPGRTRPLHRPGPQPATIHQAVNRRPPAPVPGRQPTATGSGARPPTDGHRLRHPRPSPPLTHARTATAPHTHRSPRPVPRGCPAR